MVTYNIDNTFDQSGNYFLPIFQKYRT